MVLLGPSFNDSFNFNARTRAGHKPFVVAVVVRRSANRPVADKQHTKTILTQRHINSRALETARVTGHHMVSALGACGHVIVTIQRIDKTRNSREQHVVCELLRNTQLIVMPCQDLWVTLKWDWQERTQNTPTQRTLNF